MFIVVDSHNAVFNDDAFAWESDDALDDILIGFVGGNGAGGGVRDTLSLISLDGVFVFVDEDNDLPTFGDVFVASEVCPRNGGAIDNNSVVVVEGIFHADTDYVVTAIDISIEKESAKDDSQYKNAEAENIFE